MRIDVESIAAAKDPKRAIFDRLAPALKTIPRLYGNRVLLATYIRPEKTAGGIYRPTSDIEEDRYQGKAGLILRIGEQAFENDETYKWGVRPCVGDWVFFWPSDSREIGLAGLSCRVIRDFQIAGPTTDPMLLY